MRLVSALRLCALLFVLTTHGFVSAKPHSSDLALSQYAQNRSKASSIKNNSISAYLTMKDFARIKANRDKHISFQGTVSSFRAAWNERAPNIIYTANGKDKFEIVFWTEEIEETFLNKISKKGSSFFVTGVVQNYNGRLQLKVENNKFLSSTPLNRDLLATNLTREKYKEHTDKTSSRKMEKEGIRWEPYSPLQVQQTIAANGHGLVYVRTESSPLCTRFEQAYLLHKDAYTTMGDQTIYFINASDSLGLDFAKQLKVSRVPALVLLKEGEASAQMFTYTQQSTPSDVFEFMNSVPKK